ncbi:MAG: hypothetical protein M0R30_00350 [Methanoregula sp.]|jgi:hypothetical protein|uniref:hypothetical protein n=1 Tax=Methanoregula sp. TaxID=2052170 RepID=UPI0025CE379A|nr:hypothetical protein [Methanoregula sp.]MCK9630070.1 hypothetical protein [Methanoregula sp.]
MQLPRGTFREIRKKATIGRLLSELEQTRFTGTCSIFAGPATGTFVFREGACILAKFRGKPGDAGWDEMQKSAGESFDVILSTLDETQIKLSLEFNPACKIVKGGKVPSAHPAAPPVAPVSPAPKRLVITAELPVPAIRHKALTSPAAPRVPVQTPPVPEEETIESDLDALDSMDLDHVTARIRSDCMMLVKQLNLEHLMER